LPTELKTEHGTEAVERLQPAGALEGSAGGSALQRSQEERGGARWAERVDPRVERIERDESVAAVLVEVDGSTRRTAGARVVMACWHQSSGG
jgi:hypothetical protein